MGIQSFSEISDATEAAVAAALPAVAMVSANGAVPRSALVITDTLFVTSALDATSGEYVHVTRHTGDGFEARVLAFSAPARLALLERTADDNGDVAAARETAHAALQHYASERADQPVTLGALVITVAYPSSEGPEARLGIVRCVGSDGSYFQTDSAAFPGFAGAPVVDSRGVVIGITAVSRHPGDTTIMPVSRLVDIWDTDDTSSDGGGDSSYRGWYRWTMGRMVG